MKLGRYKHYKGNFYEVIALAKHSETLEELVVYKALYDSKDFGNNAVWVRPIKMFEESLDFEGKIVKRFTFIESS
ncbi:MAG: DUF1653 domain-containing protein [Nanoarchaeota archaeon]